MRRVWQGTVLSIAVDLSALPYLLPLLPGPIPSGHPRSVVSQLAPTVSVGKERRAEVRRILGRRKSVGRGGARDPEVGRDGARDPEVGRGGARDLEVDPEVGRGEARDLDVGQGGAHDPEVG